MNKKGFLLIEVLLGLFLFGIIAVSCLPILNTSLNNLRFTKDKMDMVFMVESTMEQIKSFDYNLTNDDKYLFDMKLKEVIRILREEDPVTITLPLDLEDNKFPYKCTIYKEDKGKNLWSIEVEISTLKDEQRVKDVKVVTIVPIPQERNEKE